MQGWPLPSEVFWWELNELSLEPNLCFHPHLERPHLPSGAGTGLEWVWQGLEHPELGEGVPWQGVGWDDP